MKQATLIIHSLDEIPQFSSEDEERDWWATHDFSDELYEELKPGWNDLQQILFAPLVASRVPQVEFPLALAKRHLSRAKRRGATRPRLEDDLACQDAVTAMVFSAAAIETALNLRAVLEGKGAEQHGMDICERLIRVASEPAFEDQAALITTLQALFTRRDQLVHGVPVSTEPLTFIPPSAQDFDLAVEYYEATWEFLDRLLLAYPEERRSHE